MPLDVNSVASESVVEETVEHVVDIWGNIWDWIVHNWPSFVFFAVILVGGWLIVGIIIKIMKHALKRAGAEKSVITFVSSVSKYLLRLVVIVFSLYPFGLHFSTVLAALGAAGLGLGLGLKECVSNIASGIQIIATKPFSVGHYIALNNVEGTVTRVEIMFTTLKTLESNEVVIPNATITAGTLTNFTSLGVRRVEFNFNLQYGSDLGRIREMLMNAAKEHPMVLEEPISRFIVLGQGPDGISCSLRLFTAPENYWLLFWEFNEVISNMFRDENVRIPYNQLDVHICRPEDAPAQPEVEIPQNKTET